MDALDDTRRELCATKQRLIVLTTENGKLRLDRDKLIGQFDDSKRRHDKEVFKKGC